MNIYVHTRRVNYKIEYFALDEHNTELFKNSFDGFENESIGIIEFIACVHALMYEKKNSLNCDIYVYNEYIKKSVEEKKYKHQAKTEKGKELLRRAKMFLTDYKKTIIIYLNK